jgi:hypothetical protein
MDYAFNLIVIFYDFGIDKKRDCTIRNRCLQRKNVIIEKPKDALSGVALQKI